MVCYQSYLVLRNLKKLADNTESELAFVCDTTLICVDRDTSKSYDYSKYKGEIKGIIDDLVSSGHLVYSRDKDFFSITTKGIHPFQEISASIIRFLLTSIVVPIAVSILTTLLTLNLFGAI